MAPWERMVGAPDDADYAGIRHLDDAFAAVRGMLIGPASERIGADLSEELLSDAFQRRLFGRVVLNAQACTNGAGVYVIQSNFNHSCCPNVIVREG